MEDCGVFVVVVGAGVVGVDTGVVDDAACVYTSGTRIVRLE